MSLFALFKSGGVIMYPLLFCSLIIWAVIFERYWEYYKFRKVHLALFSTAKNLLKEGKKTEVKGLYLKTDEIISRPHLELFEENFSPEKQIQRMQRRLKETQIYLKNHLWILGTIGSSAPFIGLFGTVSGIVRSFESIATSGKSGFSVVASGLAEALIATAAGILVAVIAIVFYNYFQVKASSLLTEFKNNLEEISDYF